MSNRFLELRASGEYIDRTFFIPSLIKNRSTSWGLRRTSAGSR